MKRYLIIILISLVCTLGLLSCSKSKDATENQFSGIKVRVEGTEYTLAQLQYQFLIEKVITGGVTRYRLRTRTPSSPEINSIDFNIASTTLTPGVYTYRIPSDIGVSIKINRTTSGGYYFMPKLTTFAGQATSDFRMTLSTKSNSLGTGDFSITCWNTNQGGVGITSQEYSVQGNFFNIPILE